MLHLNNESIFSPILKKRTKLRPHNTQSMSNDGHGITFMHTWTLGCLKATLTYDEDILYDDMSQHRGRVSNIIHILNTKDSMCNTLLLRQWVEI